MNFGAATGLSSIAYRIKDDRAGAEAILMEWGMWGSCSFQSVGCDERPIITILNQGGHEYQQNTLNQYVETVAIEATCRTKHDNGRMRWPRVKFEGTKRPKSRRRMKLTPKSAFRPPIRNLRDTKTL